MLLTIHDAGCLFSALQQIPDIGSRNGIGYAARIAERSLLRAFYEDHIDHPIDKPGLGIIQRAAAAAWIGRAIKLEYGISRLLQLPDHFGIKLPRIVRG
jgi:hypothetical protein